MNSLKKIFVIYAVLFLLTGCTNPSAVKLVDNPETRATIISRLLDKHDYRSQIIDSMAASGHAAIINEIVQNKNMMGQMMRNDSMIEGMIKMCDQDSSLRNKMCDMIMVNKNMAKCMMEKMHGKNMMNMGMMNMDMKGKNMDGSMNKTKKKHNMMQEKGMNSSMNQMQ